MAVLSKTKTFTIPTGSATAIDIDPELLGDVVPQLVLGVWEGAPAAGAGNGDQRFGMFVTDGTRHFSHNNTDGDNATTGSPAGTTSRDDGSLIIVQAVGDNSVVDQLVFTSLSGTLFRVTPANTFGSDLIVTVTFLALTGAGEGIYVDPFTTPATAADISRTPWTGVTPDWAIAIFGLTGAAMNATGGRAHLSIGLITAASQVCAWKGHEEAVSNYTYDAIKTGSCALGSANGTSFIDEMASLGFQSGGITLDRITGTAARPICLIYGKGGVPVVGTFALRNSNGTINVSTPNHESKFLLCAACPPAAATESAPAEPGELMIGVASGASEREASWIYNHNAEPIGGGSPTDVLSYHTSAKLLERRTRTATDTTSQAELVDIQSIAMGSITLDQTVNDGVLTLVAFLSLGDGPKPRTAGVIKAFGGARIRRMLTSVAFLAPTIPLVEPAPPLIRKSLAYITGFHPRRYLASARLISPVIAPTGVAPIIPVERKAKVLLASGQRIKRGGQSQFLGKPLVYAIKHEMKVVSLERVDRRHRKPGSFSFSKQLPRLASVPGIARKGTITLAHPGRSAILAERRKLHSFKLIESRGNLAPPPAPELKPAVLAVPLSISSAWRTRAIRLHHHGAVAWLRGLTSVPGVSSVGADCTTISSVAIGVEATITILGEVCTVAVGDT